MKFLSLFPLVHAIHIIRMNNNTTLPLTHRALLSSEHTEIHIGTFHCLLTPLSTDQVAQIWSLPEVAYIEEDQHVYQSSTPLGRTTERQSQAPDHLVRLVHHEPWSEIRDKEYIYDATGKGVTVYVLDGGVSQISEFGERLRSGLEVAERGDGEEHGTHVAELIGGARYGVAKEVEIVDVVVLSHWKGWISDVIRGIEWSVRDCGGGLCVINLSLSTVGLPPSLVRPLNDAVDLLFHAGVVVVLSLGNFQQLVDFTAPGGASELIVVGGMDHRQDTIASWSNYASDLTPNFLFAPAVNVESSSMVANGTSSAALLTAGVVLLYLEKGAPRVDIGMVLRAKSTKKLLKTTDKFSLYRYHSSPNRLLYCAPITTPMK